MAGREVIGTTGYTLTRERLIRLAALERDRNLSNILFGDETVERFTTMLSKNSSGEPLMLPRTLGVLGARWAVCEGDEATPGLFYTNRQRALFGGHVDTTIYKPSKDEALVTRHIAEGTYFGDFLDITTDNVIKSSEELRLRTDALVSASFAVLRAQRQL